MSAFGTCGLSLGVTDDISGLTKVILMILMFIGRVGLISFIIMIVDVRNRINTIILKNVFKLVKYISILRNY